MNSLYSCLGFYLQFEILIRMIENVEVAFIVIYKNVCLLWEMCTDRLLSCLAERVPAAKYKQSCCRPSITHVLGADHNIDGGKVVSK
jgi:hypothetical protein